MEAITESPSLLWRLDGTPAGPRKTDGCFDFGDMRTVGLRVAACGDESYKGMFLGHSLRLGFVVGVLQDPTAKEVAFTKGESFWTKQEMQDRWFIDDIQTI